MHDIFEFLIQTVHVSLTGAFLLLVKRLFRDKLPPVWQLGIWSILAFSLVVPYSVSGNILFLSEIVKTAISGEITVSRPSFFFPITDFSAPDSISDILFFIYITGVIIFLLRYLISYLRLKIITAKCIPLEQEKQEKLNSISLKYKLKSCKAATMNGLSSPFVFGFLRPVLILPEEFPDEKIILHELLHLKYKDVLWGFVIALFRSIHWCNPFLWYCFNKINNDIEELCDSRALSLLEGEGRREYGNLLLSMANEKYASCIGTTSIANGGKNISSRIETIVRFKHYPQNNSLICICITIILASFLLINVNASSAPDSYLKITDINSVDRAFAASRSYFCTTPASALDTYAKAVIQNNGIYRAISAPLSMHGSIKNTIKENLKENNFPLWDSGANVIPVTPAPYCIYNFEETGKDEYSAYLAFRVQFYDPDEEANQKIIYQKLKISKEDFRWVVTEGSGFTEIITDKVLSNWGCEDLPTYVYRAKAEDFDLERHYQLSFSLKNGASNTDAPLLKADFYEVTVNTFSRCVYTGPEEKKSEIHHLRFSCSTEASRPGIIDRIITDPTFAEKSETFKNMSEALKEAQGGNFSSNSSDGSSISAHALSENWNNIQSFGGGGHTTEYKKERNYLPEIINAELRINNEYSVKAVLERVDEK